MITGVVTANRHRSTGDDADRRAEGDIAQKMALPLIGLSYHRHMATQLLRAPMPAPSSTSSK